ncbi:putative diacylglycerol O-acyltransferase tgs1, partial [Sarracenia purpurea var. burkii]
WAKRTLSSANSTKVSCSTATHGGSVTPEHVAYRIAERTWSCVIESAKDLQKDTSRRRVLRRRRSAIQFAQYFDEVIRSTSTRVRLSLRRQRASSEPLFLHRVNYGSPIRSPVPLVARVYGVEDRITFVHADVRDWIRNYGAFASASSGSAGGSQAQADGNDRKVDAVFLSPPWGVLNKKKVKPALQRMGEALSGNIPERERRTHMHLSHEGVLWTNASSDMVPTTTLPKANQANGDIRDPDLNYQLSNIAETYIYAEYSRQEFAAARGFCSRATMRAITYARQTSRSTCLPSRTQRGSRAGPSDSGGERPTIRRALLPRRIETVHQERSGGDNIYYGELANEKFSSTL